MNEKRKSQIILYGSLTAILVVAALIMNFGRAFIIRQVGIDIAPEEGFYSEIPEDINYYRQDDERWKSVPLGGTEEYTIGSSGCLVCCIATTLEYWDIAADPMTVNDAFMQNGVFSSEADVVWKDIKNVYPTVDYRYSNAFSAEDIDADLAAGLFPIVKVRYRGSGVFHWLLIVGAEEGEYMVMDPLADSPVPLSTHGKVYAYRVLFPAAQDQ